MKMKKKALLFSLLALVVAGAVASGASAGWFGGGFRDIDPEVASERQVEMFEHQAEMLGVGVDEVKQAWADGKNPKELAEELGLDMDELREKMQENRKQMMEERLQSLVNSGVITQAQADSRLEHMEERMAEGGPGQGRMGKGRCECSLVE